MNIDEELAQEEADAAELEQLSAVLQSEVAGIEEIEQQYAAFLETL